MITIRFALMLLCALVLMNSCGAISPTTLPVQPTPAPITLPPPTVTRSPTLTPEPVPTPATPIQFSWTLQDIVTLPGVPSKIHGIATLILSGRPVSEQNRRELDEWIRAYAYQEAPPDVAEIYHKLQAGEPVNREEMLSHNAWVESYNRRTIPLVTATAQAIAQATATAETIQALAEQGIECGSLPRSETKLTSPVARYVAISAVDTRYPLGLVRRDWSTGMGVAFHLEPETDIYAPISGKLYVGGGVSWKGTYYTTLDIQNGDTEVTLVLPVLLAPSHVEEFRSKYEVCEDCVEIPEIRFYDDPDSDYVLLGRPWVDRGERIAIYHKGQLPVGGFTASIVISVQVSDEILDLDVYSTLWYGGYPTVCREWQ